MTDQATNTDGRKTPKRPLINGSSLFNPKVLLGKIRRRSMRYYRRWFCQQNYIYRHLGPFLPEEPVNCNFEYYQSFEQVPEKVKAEIRSDGKANRLQTDKLELDENATLWIAFVDGLVASTVFTRRGQDFRRWFLEIRPEDVVVFRLRTHPDFRGRGLAPSLIQHVLSALRDELRHAYIDCRTYNKPSIRCIEKAGFKWVATKKTIKREWALYN